MKSVGRKEVRELLESEISEAAFGECWNGDVPPYQDFIDAAAERFSSGVSGQVSELSAVIRSDGNNRVRIDGTFKEDGCDREFYAHLVWLPSFGLYRGKISIWVPLPPAAPKSIEQFIADLDAIVDENELILEGHIFQALRGVDETAGEISKASPAIIRLFERFPNDDSSMHWYLMDLLEKDSSHEALLFESVRRKPNVPALRAIQGVLYGARSDGDRSRWLSELKRVAAAENVPQTIVAFAEDLLSRYFEQTGAEPRDL
ncbi:MAG TPA: hypothetical protein VGE67_19035 [Haloferula sp.]